MAAYTHNCLASLVLVVLCQLVQKLDPSLLVSDNRHHPVTIATSQVSP